MRSFTRIRAAAYSITLATAGKFSVSLTAYALSAADDFAKDHFYVSK